jgi:Ca2+/H+ antiporter
MKMPFCTFISLTLLLTTCRKVTNINGHRKEHKDTRGRGCFLACTYILLLPAATHLDRQLILQKSEADRMPLCAS